jgi:hypothetical protein
VALRALSFQPTTGLWQFGALWRYRSIGFQPLDVRSKVEDHEEYGGDQAAAHGLTALKQIVSIDFRNDLPSIRKLAARQVDRKHPGGGACEKFRE